MSIIGKNIIVYDLEIKKPIEECSKGWASHDEMGISVGCAFDYRDNRYRVFMDDNICELVERMNEPGTIVVAFNQIGFDNKLLRADKNLIANGKVLKNDLTLRNYDMLEISRQGAGAKLFSKGFKLDDHLRVLGLPMKTGEGSLAPIWWKEGKTGKVIDYCLNDVSVERMLFEHIVSTGKLASEFRREPYPVRLFDEFIE